MAAALLRIVIGWRGTVRIWTLDSSLTYRGHLTEDKSLGKKLAGKSLPLRAPAQQEERKLLSDTLIDLVIIQMIVKGFLLDSFEEQSYKGKGRASTQGSGASSSAVGGDEQGEIARRATAIRLGSVSPDNQGPTGWPSASQRQAKLGQNPTRKVRRGSAQAVDRGERTTVCRARKDSRRRRSRRTPRERGLQESNEASLICRVAGNEAQRTHQDTGG